MSLTTIDFSRLDLRPGDKLLDLGCGEGRHAITAYLEQNVQVVGVDLSIKDLGTAAERFTDFEDVTLTDRTLAFINSSGLQLPFADATFDKVICAEVLEHIPDYQQMLAEINRVLKPGGVFAVSVPRWFPEWVCWQFSDEYHEVEGGHVRIFKAGELHDAIRHRGFYRFARHFAHGLHSPYWWLRCMFWKRGEDVWPVRTYHRMLVWDLMKKPWITQLLDRLLNPLIGKSVVMYFVRGNA